MKQELMIKEIKLIFSEKAKVITGKKIRYKIKDLIESKIVKKK